MSVKGWMDMRLLKQFHLPDDGVVRLGENHHKRLALAYQAVALTLVIVGIFWLIWRVIERDWSLILTNVIYVGAGLYLWFRIRTGRFHLAAMAVLLFLSVSVAYICLVYDVPSPASPRVTQIYFLALAFLSYVTFRDDNPRLTHTIVLANLVGFVIFSSTSYAAPFAQPLPDHVRLLGSWVHSIVATGIMCACVYIMQSEFSARSSYGRLLATALAERQFELYYQPQVDGDGAVLGAEALLRWWHPKRGFVAPCEFIPAAEQLGMMRPIGRWVLEAACAQLSEWRTVPGRSGFRLAVNVSPQQFHDPAFVGEVREVVTRHGICPSRLKLELTESLVIGDIDDVVDKMIRLEEFGVTLSLDDFGTGYSSLRYLKRMPFDQVKIDRGFIRDMLDDERDAVIVKGIVQLGHELHLSVLAEGVESIEQRDYLLELGCLEFQGYFFGRPMPIADFESITGVDF